MARAVLFCIDDVCVLPSFLDVYSLMACGSSFFGFRDNAVMASHVVATALEYSCTCKGMPRDTRVFKTFSFKYPVLLKSDYGADWLS